MIIDDDSDNDDDDDNGEAYCHFYWASKTWSGGYAYMTTSTKDCSFTTAYL